jgi:two-component system alkaline phosphatase synthesis response regulator PhoP
MHCVKVLLVENDPHTIELMRLRLEALNCDVTVATTADEALKSAQEEIPVLILADLNLDGGITEGMELLKQLTDDPRTAEIPVYIHSVFVSHVTDVPEAQSLASGFLLKPLKVNDLKELLASARA